jgi:hypothetical protein
LLLRDGDQLVLEDAMLAYRASDGTDLRFTTSPDKTLLHLNGKVVAVTLTGREDGLAWLTQAADADLARVRTITIKGGMDQARLAALQRLALRNPQIALSLDGQTGEKAGAGLASPVEVLALFSPRTLWVSDTLAEPRLRVALARAPQMETLMGGEMNEAGSFDEYRGLSQLKRLAISRWHVAKAGPLPAGLQGLKTLAVYCAEGLTNLAPLATLPAGIEELSLVGCDKLKDLKGVARWSSLKTLVLTHSGDEHGLDLSELNQLPQLEWVGLPATLSQEQLAAFAATHPRLKVLELSNQAKLDLSPLSNCRQLEGLVLLGDYDNLAIIRGVRSLRFVGLSKELFVNAPDQVKAIQQALPEALVVPVRPFCLGSGWILLLAPLVILLYGCRRYRAVRPAAGGNRD